MQRVKREDYNKVLKRLSRNDKFLKAVLSKKNIKRAFYKVIGELEEK